MEGNLYWITGLSGAGKTTIGKLLYEKIKENKPNIFFLDGDIARWAYNDKSGYAKEERKDAAYRNSRVCKIIVEQEIDVICCTVGMFDCVREWNRKNFSKYHEIFIDVPMEILIKRDKKGLYSGIKEGKAQDVVGVDLKLELPKNPDLKINNDGTFSPEHALELIMVKLTR